MFESMDEIIKCNDSNERLVMSVSCLILMESIVNIKIQLTPENEQKLFI